MSSLCEDSPLPAPPSCPCVDQRQVRCSAPDYFPQVFTSAQPYPEPSLKSTLPMSLPWTTEVSSVLVLPLCRHTLHAAARISSFFINTFHWSLFLSVLVDKCPVCDVWDKKRTQGTPCCVIPQAPRPLACLFSSIQSSYVCFIYNVWGFKLYLAGGIGKSASSPPGPDMKVQNII